MAKQELSQAEEKVAAAEKAKSKQKKAKNPDGNIFVRAGKAIKRFFKDEKGEIKKIIWPDRKTVLKSTAVVLMVVAIVGLAIFGIDQLLAFLLSLLERAAEHLATKGAETEAGVIALGNSFLG